MQISWLRVGGGKNLEGEEAADPPLAIRSLLPTWPSQTPYSTLRFALHFIFPETTKQLGSDLKARFLRNSLERGNIAVHFSCSLQDSTEY